jgi:hypothetical protein
LPLSEILYEKHSYPRKIRDAMKNTFTKLKGGNLKMEQSEESANKPDFRGNLSVSAWINEDKNGRKYLSILLGNRINLFRHITTEDGSDDLYCDECRFEDIFE